MCVERRIESQGEDWGEKNRIRSSEFTCSAGVLIERAVNWHLECYVRRVGRQIFRVSVSEGEGEGEG